MKYFQRHAPGITSLVFHEKYNYISCGSDGVVYKSNLPSEKDELCVVDGNPTCLACMGDLVLIASTCNLNSYDVKDGVFAKQIGKFNVKITCLASDGKNENVILGLEDFKIKRINIHSHKQSTFEGHKAPILYIDLNHDSSYLASSSCDGTIKIWDYEDILCVYTFNLLTKSNSFGLSKSLGRLSWSPSSKYIAIPREKEAKVYQIDTWKIKCTLTHPKLFDFLNTAKFSPCETFFGSWINRRMYICFQSNNIIFLYKYDLDKKVGVCDLMFSPSSNLQYNISFTDVHGRLGQFQIPKVVNSKETLASIDIEDLDVKN